MDMTNSKKQTKSGKHLSLGTTKGKVILGLGYSFSNIDHNIYSYGVPHKKKRVIREKLIRERNSKTQLRTHSKVQYLNWEKGQNGVKRSIRENRR